MRQTRFIILLFCEMHFLNDSTVEQWPAGAWCVELRDVMGLYLFSDGLESFCFEREILSPLEPLRELLRIRTLHGSFVQRRCHRFLNKECPARGWHHFDDFSMVGIHLGENYEDYPQKEHQNCTQHHDTKAFPSCSNPSHCKA